MAKRCKLFGITHLLGERSSAWIEPSSREHRIPERYPKIPGYVEKMQEVVAGKRDPWWGTEYASSGRFPADLVQAAPALHAASDRLRALFEDNEVAGVRFFPIMVDGAVPMHLMVIDGRVEVNPQAFELQLVDGAEIGRYRMVGMCVSPRVMKLLRDAKIKMYSRCVVKER